MKKRRPGAGRPVGSTVALFDDPERFALAAWWAFDQLGLGPYRAAYLAVLLIESNEPITAPTIEGTLTRMSTVWRERPTTTFGRHADGLLRKARRVLPVPPMPNGRGSAIRPA